MRVLEVGALPFPSPQGSQVHLRGTARALARRGHAVTVVCYGHGDPAPRGEGYTIRRLPRVPGYRRMRSGPDLVKPFLDLGLAGLLTRIDADVVHAHNLEALGAALLARVHTGRPVVYDAHTLFEEELPTYLPRGRRPARWLGRLADRALPARADAIATLSARALRGWAGLGIPCALAPPGIDPADLAGVRPRRSGSGPVVVYAGNPDGYQDLPVLYAALRRLPEVRLRIVTAARWGPVPPGVEVVHAPRWEDARAWIAGADAAAVPRTRCAGYPMKLLACLGLGLPTVIAAGSARGLPGEHVVPDGDPAAFAEALRVAIVAPRVDPAEVLQAASWDHRAEVLEGLFHTVVSHSRRPRV